MARLLAKGSIVTMDLHYLLVAEARQADVTRHLQHRTLAATLRACRRRLLGLLPVGAPCEPRAAC